MKPFGRLTFAAFGMIGMPDISHAATVTDLAHRWSFDNAFDSVGGANATLHGKALFASGSLELPSTSGIPRTDYANVDIGGTIAGSSSLTVESWFTIDTAYSWSKVWMFGINSGTTTNMDFTALTFGGNYSSVNFDPLVYRMTNTRSGANPPASILGGEIFSSVVFDSANDLIFLYLNGALADSVPWNGVMSDMGNTPDNFFGAATGYGDRDFDGRINEIRIWKTALTGAEVATNAAAGPNLVGVPEPGISALCLVSTLALIRRRRSDSMSGLEELSRMDVVTGIPIRGQR